MNPQMKLFKQLTNYSSQFIEEGIYKQQMLSFLTTAKEPFSRSNQDGHFTASAFLLNSQGDKFFLLHHAKLQKWMQPGGHCDGDSDVLRVAIKEASEESGINNIKFVSSEIFDIDIHRIPSSHGQETHLHYDVRFLLQTVDSEALLPNHESTDMIWADKSVAQKLALEHSTERMIEKWQKYKA